MGKGVGLGWGDLDDSPARNQAGIKPAKGGKSLLKKLKGGSVAKKVLCVERRLKHPQHVGDAEIPDFCTEEKGALLPRQHYASLQYCRGIDLVAPERF